MSWPVIIVVSLTSGLLGSLGMGAGAVLLLYLRVFGGAGQFEAQGINLIFCRSPRFPLYYTHATDWLAGKRQGSVSWRDCRLCCSAFGLAGLRAAAF